MVSRSRSPPSIPTDNKKWQSIAELDIRKLEKEISTIRPGRAFVIDVSAGDVSNRTDYVGTNIHVPIKFDSGEEWLLRIPSFSDDPPEPATSISEVHISEVLTYKALRAAGVAVPEVYGWGMGTMSKTASEQNSGVAFFLILHSPLMAE